MNVGEQFRTLTLADGADDDIVADPSGEASDEYAIPNKARVPGNGKLAYMFWYEWLDVSGAPVYDATKECTLRPVLAVDVAGATQYLDLGEAETVSARNPVLISDIKNKDHIYVLVSDIADPPTGATQIALYGRELEL